MITCLLAFNIVKRFLIAGELLNISDLPVVVAFTVNLLVVENYRRRLVSDSFAIKIAAGFFENHRLGLPTGSGMMVLVSAKTGRPEAVLLDNGYLTDVRTGAAGALAARYLACKRVETAGVIGSGMQARYQIRALKQVRDFQRLMVYGIVPEQVEQYVVSAVGSLRAGHVAIVGP